MNDTVEPEIEHTELAEASMVNATVRPDAAVAAPGAVEVKVIVWLALPTEMVTVAVELPALFLMTYLNVSSPMKPVAGMKLKLPSALRGIRPLGEVGGAAPIVVCAAPGGAP